MVAKVYFSFVSSPLWFAIWLCIFIFVHSTVNAVRESTHSFLGVPISDSDSEVSISNGVSNSASSLVYDATVPISSSGRPNCGHLFSHVFGWNDRGNICQLAFYTFLALPRSEEGTVNMKNIATQKRLLSTLETLQHWQDYGIRRDELQALSTCDVNLEDGRTVGMQMIFLGLASAIKSSFAQTYIFTRQSLHLTDAKNNTILHLAARSGDISTLDAAMQLLHQRTNVHYSQLQQFFDRKNADGKTALESLLVQGSGTEVERTSLPMVNKLKAYYRSISTFARLQELAERDYGQPRVYIDQL